MVHGVKARHLRQARRQCCISLRFVERIYAFEFQCPRSGIWRTSHMGYSICKMQPLGWTTCKMEDLITIQLFMIYWSAKSEHCRLSYTSLSHKSQTTLLVGRIVCSGNRSLLGDATQINSIIELRTHFCLTLYNV